MPIPIGESTAITSEEQLLQQGRSGDRAAFEALVMPHFAVARSLAARLLGNLEDAEDAVQEALIKTHRGLGGFRGGPSGFRGWFLRIVFNQATDARRRRATRRGYEHGVAPVLADSPVPRVEQRETLLRVRAAIEELPPRQQAALHLRVVEELSYREIAEVLGITVGSARVYLVRARSLLRERLTEELT